MEIELPYEPTAKQALFHASTAEEVLYGGAAGGGKSKAIVMEALLDALEHPGTHSYLFRKTYPELRDTLVAEALSSTPPMIGQYSGSAHDLRLINGSVLHFRHCRNSEDARKYQGAEMHRLYIDELTHFTSDTVEYLKTRVRAVKELGITPRMRFTTNPGGVGHGWVKSRFIEGKQPFTLYREQVYSPMLGESKETTTQYIPATATDNPHLTKDYIFQLEQKPEALRKALLYGNWDVFEGQVYTEFRDDPAHYDDQRYTHVIRPFNIPKQWRHFRTFDWGYSRPFSVGYWAMSPDGTLYRYSEIYGSPKDPGTRRTARPNEGLRKEPSWVAKTMADYEKTYEKGVAFTGIADPSIFDESRGGDGSIAKLLGKKGIYFERGDNARLAGKMQLHYRLAFDENGKAGLYVFENCKDFIRTIPALVYSPTDVEDVDTGCEDHIYDETRYLCMYNPCPPPRKTKGLERKGEDPLDLWSHPKKRSPFGVDIVL